MDDLDDNILPDDFDAEDDQLIDDAVNSLMSIIDKQLNKMGYHDNTTIN